jgi:hypothetical protein
MDESLQRAMKLTQEQKILVRLVKGDLVPKSELVDLLWGDDPDGGPEWAESRLYVLMTYLRRRLRREGWDVEVVSCYALGTAKGRIFEGWRPSQRTATGSGSRRTSRRTGGDSSQRKNLSQSSQPTGNSPAPSPPMPSSSRLDSFGLTDFLSKPSQRIAS